MNWFTSAIPNKAAKPANGGANPNGAAPAAGNMGNPAGTANTPGNVPNQGQQGNNQNAQTTPPADPFEKFAKMWDTPSTQTDLPPSFKLDPTVLKEAAGAQDFMKGLDPALMQRATSGDTSALMEMMNSVARNVYQTALEHGGTLTDKFVGAREAHSAKGFGQRVKGELTTNELSNNSQFQHPVVKKQLTEVASRLSVQHPDASPQEIAKMAKEYITQLADALRPSDSNGGPNGSKAEPQERGEEYWNHYFGDEEQTQG